MEQDIKNGDLIYRPRNKLTKYEERGSEQEREALPFTEAELQLLRETRQLLEQVDRALSKLTRERDT
jgi:hypothetical protein